MPLGVTLKPSGLAWLTILPIAHLCRCHYLLYEPLRGPLIYMVVGSNGRQWAGKKKSDSDKGKEEGEALAAAANDEADKRRKTRRERLMSGDDDEERKRKRKLYILDFRKNFQFLA